LQPGAAAQVDLWRTERIAPVEPTDSQLHIARAALQVAERLLGPTTYARVDLIPLTDGSSAVLELELLDPALFFEHHPAGAVRFAEVLDEALSRD
jgi:O-ureido-D-serine cyclo-ligase